MINAMVYAIAALSLMFVVYLGYDFYYEQVRTLLVPARSNFFNSGAGAGGPIWAAVNAPSSRHAHKHITMFFMAVLLYQDDLKGMVSRATGY